MVWAMLLTFPLVLNPFRNIPLGSESAATVPLFNLWALQWNIDQLMQGYPNYWDAPFFAPTKGTFLFRNPAAYGLSGDTRLAGPAITNLWI